MTYQEWADEYKKSADMIKERIAGLKNQLLSAPVDELGEIKYRIASMYQMYLDCMDIEKKLRVRKGTAF